MRRQRGLFWVLMVAAVGFWLLVHRTTFDRAFLAIGWASEGTRYAGTPVRARVPQGLRLSFTPPGSGRPKPKSVRVMSSLRSLRWCWELPRFSAEWVSSTARCWGGRDWRSQQRSRAYPSTARSGGNAHGFSVPAGLGGERASPMAFLPCNRAPRHPRLSIIPSIHSMKSLLAFLFLCRPPFNAGCSKANHRK